MIRIFRLLSLLLDLQFRFSSRLLLDVVLPRLKGRGFLGKGRSGKSVGSKNGRENKTERLAKTGKHFHFCFPSFTGDRR